MTSIPLTCPACNGTGGGYVTWTSGGTDIGVVPEWVKETQAAERCASCGGTGVVHVLVETSTNSAFQRKHPVLADAIALLRTLGDADVREVSGCAACPMSHEPVEGISSNGCCRLASMRYFADADFVGNEDAAIPNAAPEWCPLRKGPVTFKLKEGA